MVGDAIDAVKQAPPDPQIRARVWEQQASKIEQAVDGWKGADPVFGKNADGTFRTAADGAIVFAGDAGAYVLVVAPDGAVYVGRGGLRNFVDLATRTVRYDRLKPR